jgi:flagellar biosynthesis/type III secretory pathway protein FliH
MQEFAFEDLTIAPPPGAPAAGALGPSADDILDMVAQARAEADAIREAAYAEGLEAGRREALAAAAGGVDALAAAAADMRRAGAERAERLEHDAVELALALAERIVGGALAVRPELVLEAVRTSLRSVVERERVTVLVNPADLPVVAEAVGDLHRELGGIEHMDVQAERRVAMGGAIVRHAAGEVDARVETKLERAREVVESVLGESA